MAGPPPAVRPSACPGCGIGLPWGSGALEPPGRQPPVPDGGEGGCRWLGWGAASWGRSWPEGSKGAVCTAPSSSWLQGGSGLDARSVGLALCCGPSCPLALLQELLLAPALLERLTCSGELGRLLVLPANQQATLQGYRDTVCSGQAVARARRFSGLAAELRSQLDLAKIAQQVRPCLAADQWACRAVGHIVTCPPPTPSWAWLLPMARTPSSRCRPRRGCRRCSGICWTPRKPCRTWTCCRRWPCCFPRVPVLAAHQPHPPAALAGQPTAQGQAPTPQPRRARRPPQPRPPRTLSKASARPSFSSGPGCSPSSVAITGTARCRAWAGG